MSTIYRGSTALRLRRKKFSTPYGRRTTYRSTMYYGNMRTRARGNIEASKRGTDCAETVIQGMLNVPITVTTTTTATYSNGEVVAIPIWQLMFNSEYWPKMKDLWDEVKITGVQCKLLGNSAASTVLASGLSSVGVLVAIDRNGVSGSLKSPGWKGDELEGTKKGAFIMYLDGSSAENVNNALAYGSCRTKNWSPGNAFYQWISCYPSSLSEKDPWLNCDDGMANLAEFRGAGNPTIFELGFPNGMNVKSQNNYSGMNGNFRSFGFDPVLLIGVYNVPMVAASSTVARQTFTFSLEFKIATVWRGPRGQKTDISNNISLEPTPQATELDLNYTSNTPAGGDIHTGLFKKVTVRVDVPQNEDVPTTFNHIFTEDTGASGVSYEGLWNRINITVLTRKTAYYFKPGQNAGYLSLTQNMQKIPENRTINVPDGNWLLQIYKDDAYNPGVWVVTWLYNSSGNEKLFNINAGRCYGTGRMTYTTDGSVAFYEDDTAVSEVLLRVDDTTHDDSAGSTVLVNEKMLIFMLPS